jgi:hypothetical protein
MYSNVYILDNYYYYYYYYRHHHQRLYSPLLGLSRYFNLPFQFTVGATPRTGDQPKVRPLQDNTATGSGIRTHNPQGLSGGTITLITNKTLKRIFGFWNDKGSHSYTFGNSPNCIYIGPNFTTQL